jgi:hypothetical protein
MIVPGTNALSEMPRPTSVPQVEALLAAQAGTDACFTAVGELEPRHGVALLPAPSPPSAAPPAAVSTSPDSRFGRVFRRKSASVSKARQSLAECCRIRHRRSTGRAKASPP